MVNVQLKINALLLTVGTLLAAFSALADNVPPSIQNTTTNIGFDRRGIPKEIHIWANAMIGSDSSGCSGVNSCSGHYGSNTLVCFSNDDPAFGACPTQPFWNAATARNYDMQLTFTHTDTKATKVVQMDAAKNGFSNTPSWTAGSRFSSGTNGARVSIKQNALSQLDIPGEWKAMLKMQVMTWQYCAESGTTGCPGDSIASWQAIITFMVSDTGTQQIYFPEFKLATPRIDLNLSNRPGTTNNTYASGSRTLDMCLYDGSNSTSNRINLLFQDEGVDEPDRVAGRFSLYRDGAAKEDASNRIDYEVSVINPTNGNRQNIRNGTEINWTNTNNRNIQREVVIPGIPGPLLCVPAPLTLTTPQFRIADKSAGHYTGTLRIIYTPTTTT